MEEEEIERNERSLAEPEPRPLRAEAVAALAAAYSVWQYDITSGNDEK
jgi:hypothetical protein